MKTTVKNDTIIVESEVTTTPTMADMLSAYFGVDLIIDQDGHLVLKQKINEGEDIETQIKVAKETIRDMEGTMLNREVEEETKKAEEDQKEADAKNMDALVQEMGKLVDDVTAGKYGPARIALFADNPTRVGYRGNMPPEAGALFAFLVANE